MNGLSGISMHGWMRLGRWTVFGTLGCIAISVTFNYFFFWTEQPDVLKKALISAAVIPVILAGPLFFYLTLKLRELAIANHRLSHLASTDSLTGCLNRGAFTRHIDQFFENGNGARPTGALLVIDADHFKSINDRFGHQCGDEALKLMAEVIRTSIRRTDWLGRIGGEEFGVFMQGATLHEASRVAERIRELINALQFNVEGEHRELSVSIGGAAFSQILTFTDLFRIADERLYVAKKTGRDRVEMTWVPKPNLAGARQLDLH